MMKFSYFAIFCCIAMVLLENSGPTNAKSVMNPELLQDTMKTKRSQGKKCDNPCANSNACCDLDPSRFGAGIGKDQSVLQDTMATKSDPACKRPCTHNGVPTCCDDIKFPVGPGKDQSVDRA